MLSVKRVRLVILAQKGISIVAKVIVTVMNEGLTAEYPSTYKLRQFSLSEIIVRASFKLSLACRRQSIAALTQRRRRLNGKIPHHSIKTGFH